MKTEEAITMKMKKFRTDANTEVREDKFVNQIDSKYVYRIPLTHLCNLGKINFAIKIDLKICCTLQTNVKHLYESKKKKGECYWCTRLANCFLFF